MPKNPRPVKLDLPAKGVSEATPYSKSVPGHAFDALNMVPFDRQEDRLRGGRRGGLRKFLPDAVNSTNAVQALVQAPAVTTADIEVVQTDNLVGHWKFDDGSGTTAVDESSNSLDASLINGPTWVSGEIGSNALNFNGLNQYVQTPAFSTPSSFSISCFVQSAFAFYGNDESLSFMSKRNSFMMGPVTRADQVRFVVGNTAGGFEQLIFVLSSVPGFSARDWHHFVGSFDDTTKEAKLWMDGVERVSTTLSGFTVPTDPSGRLFIGRDDAQFQYFNGRIDDVRIYDRVIGPSDIGVLSETLVLGDQIRQNFLVAAAGGNIYRSNDPPQTLTLATNGSGALTSTQQLAAVVGPPSPSDSSPADTQQHVYFVDGTNYKRLNVATNTVEDWTAAVGSMPTDDDDNTGRILALYRGRLVISGVSGDPANWFMSAADDVRDFEYSPSTPNANQAVAGNVSDAGRLGDIVTALIPFNDDVMVFGGDRTIWRLKGDPAEGGRFDNISYEAGIVGPDAWCRDTFGGVYFMTTQGLMRLSPTRTQVSGDNMTQTGGIPEIVSTAKLDRTFKNINRGTTRVLLEWDRDNQGVYIFLIPRSQPGDAPRAYWFDARTQGFWPLKFPSAAGPTAAVVYDGDAPDDRHLLMGGWDSFLRMLRDDTKNDADTSSDVAVESYVDFGPAGSDNIAQRVLLTDMLTVLDRASDPVELRLFTGATPEQAIESTTPRISRTLRGGMNNVGGQRVSGSSVLVRLYQNTLDSSWVYETGMIRLSDMGLQRGLG